MMQPELLLPFVPTFNIHNKHYDEENFYCHFSSSFASPEESSLISSNSHLQTMLSDEFLEFQIPGNEFQIISPMEGLETIYSHELEDLYENDTQAYFSYPITIVEDESSPSFSLESSDYSLEFPITEMSPIENRSSLLHLLKAYGEAMDKGEDELSMVIVKSINKRSSPVGTTMERVAYNLFQSRENQGEYLRQESTKNFIEAFKVFYQSVPYGRFAHFTANSLILESIPDHDAEVIHIVDFDMGEGIQWPLIIEALSQKKKALRLTSIKLEGQCNSSYWDFEETKKRLEGYSRQYGLNMLIDEKNIEELANDLTENNGEWLVFNCTVALPHMGRRRPRSRVNEFLSIAKNCLHIFSGVVILGDGEVGGSLNTCTSFTSFFDELLRHYEAVFDSLEKNFPVYLAEARIAMESLFVAPFMSSFDWYEYWEEIRKGSKIEFEGIKTSQESLAEAKQTVNERDNGYKVKIEELRENEVVLEWMDVPLVRVSKWM